MPSPSGTCWLGRRIVRTTAGVERARRLSQLWNWLPAFRVVAEEENLPRAAAWMHIAPSALSRSIKLLEEDLGVELFDRVGRNLRLNARGKELLSALRHAMRLIEHGVANATSKRHVGHLNVACGGELCTAIAVHAVASLQTDYPDLVIYLVRAEDSKVNAGLLAGTLDVGFVESAVDDPFLVVTPVARATYGLYARKRHALFARRSVALERALEYSFIGPPAEPNARSSDRWPSELRRTVGVRVPTVAAAVSLCASTDMLVVLPDALGAQFADRITRLPFDPIPEVQIMAVRRLTLEEEVDLAGAVVAAFASAATALDERPPTQKK